MSAVQSPSYSYARPLNFLFRGLIIFTALEVSALAYNLLLHPGMPGFIGQNFLLRIFIGLILGPAIILVGALITWQAPGNAVGRCLMLIAVAIIGGQFNFDNGSEFLSPILHPIILVYAATLAPPVLIFLMMSFPTGQIYPPKLARWIWPYLALKVAGSLLEIMASPGDVKVAHLTANPLFVPLLAPYLPLIETTIGIDGIMLLLGMVVGALSLARRYRASDLRGRQQIKWVVWAFFGLIAPLSLMMIIGFGSMIRPVQVDLILVLIGTAMLLLVSAIGIAILRYHLFDIDLIINRTLVYGLLSGFVIGMYILIVGSLSTLFQAQGNLAISLVATGIVALLFHPLRDRLQRAINHLMFGERDDPYRVLSRLGQRLDATLAPEAVLPTIVETVKETLHLPYVAVSLRKDQDFHVAAAAGEPVANPLCLPLVYQGETTGQLLVAPLTPGESFSPADRRLLDDLARHIGVATYGVRLMADLQYSRQRLVNLREEERRRLRRDLHDGLGSTLAGLYVQANALRRAIPRDPAAADGMVVEIREELRAAITDIRRLVYDLRPPALDELGLVGAIRARAAQSTLVEPSEQGYLPATNGHHPLQIAVFAPDALPALPAAIEVAVYRIVQEALTNVVTHAAATTCTVRLTLEAHTLQVEISDDGIGVPAGYTPGVGLHSMRERAAELGGVCTIQAPPSGGTQVLVRLPLPISEDNQDELSPHTHRR